MGDMSDNGAGRPPDANERAVQILRAVMAISSEIALDLDVTWSQARELFAATLFERAEGRYATAPRIAAALDTSLRTVKQYRHRRREGEAAPADPTFNMRRRVLHLLDKRPHSLEEIEEALPLGSDVNYARSAVQSLVEDGLVVRDPATGRLSQPDESFVPWYLRPNIHPDEEIQTLCNGFARLMGSRLTPKSEVAAIPALLMTMVHNLPERLVKEYQNEFTRLVTEFDARWTERLENEVSEGEEPVLGGAVVAVGEIGEEPITPERLAELEREDAEHLSFEEGEVPPAYRRYYEERRRQREGASPPDGDEAEPTT